MSADAKALPFRWRLAVAASTMVAFALLAWVAAHWIWRWAGPATPPMTAGAPADPAATIVASGLWAGGEGTLASPVAPTVGDLRLLGVLAERDGKGLAVFRTREGARVVAAGNEIAPGTRVVSVAPASVTLRDAGGERTIELRHGPAQRPASPQLSRAAPKSVPIVAARAATSPACQPPPGFTGPVLRLHAELLDGLIAQPETWRGMLAVEGGGLVVREDGGFATMLGLARGDRIAQANGIALLQPEDVTGAVLRPLAANQPVRLAGLRSGRPRELFVVNAGACP